MQIRFHDEIDFKRHISLRNKNNQNIVIHFDLLLSEVSCL